MGEEPKVEQPKRKRGRPKAASAEDLNKVLDALKDVAGRLTDMEAKVAKPMGRGPGALTRDQRLRMERMPELPGPSVEMLPDERDGKRRAEIYARRNARGRIDQQDMPSGAKSSVGTRLRPNDNPSQWRLERATPEEMAKFAKSVQERQSKAKK